MCQNGLVEKTFTASHESLPTSKVTADGETGDITWKAGDKIVVYSCRNLESWEEEYAATKAEFSLSKGAGSKTASFTGTIEENDYYAAYYPSGKDKVDYKCYYKDYKSNEGFYQHNYSASAYRPGVKYEQTEVSNIDAACVDLPMIAVNSGNSMNFQFHNCFALIKFRLSGSKASSFGALRLTIRYSSAGRQISGAAGHINYSTYEVVPETNATKQYIKYTAASSFEAGKDYYIAVLATNFLTSGSNNIRFDFITTANKNGTVSYDEYPTSGAVTKTLSVSSLKIYRNTIYDLGTIPLGD